MTLVSTSKVSLSTPSGIKEQSHAILYQSNKSYLGRSIRFGVQRTPSIAKKCIKRNIGNALCSRGNCNRLARTVCRYQSDFRHDTFQYAWFSDKHRTEERRVGKE